MRPAAADRGSSAAQGPSMGAQLTAAATRGDNAELVRLLDREGLGVDCINDSRALHLCCGEKNVEGVRLLLARRADPNLCHDGVWPVHWTVFRPSRADGEEDSKRLAILELLKGAGAELDRPSEGDGFTALHIAAGFRLTRCVGWLLANGLSVHAESFEDKQTPLHHAVDRGADGVDSPAVVTELLDAGADPNAKDSKGLSPVHLACLLGHLRSVGVLHARGGSATQTDAAGFSALHWACIRGHLEIVTMLLDCGLDNDLPGLKAMTLLHMACDMGNVEVVRELARRGANLNARSSIGATPLSMTVVEGDEGDKLRCLAVLLEAGADPNIARIGGLTPLHDACMNGVMDRARLLLEHGADPDRATDLDDTPLRIAAAYSIELVRLLLEHGAGDVNCRTTNGLTPLIAACCSPQTDHATKVEIATLLLEHGARPELPSDKGDAAIRALAAALAAVTAAPAPEGTKVCAFCHAHGATVRCGKCKAARYCDRECQKRHWKFGAHKAECALLQDPEHQRLVSLAARGVAVEEVRRLRSLLAVVRREEREEAWASAHLRLGNAYRRLGPEQELENLECADQHFRQALQVFSAASPFRSSGKWAAADNARARALLRRVALRRSGR